MARLDVEKNHKNIRKDVSFGPVSNKTTDVSASSKWSNATGRTRVPPTGDRDPAHMHATPAPNVSAKANANLPKPAGKPIVGKVSHPLTNAKAAMDQSMANGKRAPRNIIGS